MKGILKRAGLVPVLMLLMLLATSCGDVVWSPGPPPPGWTDTFYDTALTGRWQLIQANGSTVGGYATNYMEFDGYGRGYYTYWDSGVLYSERIGYWCEAPYGSYDDYQVYIEYQNSAPVTMSYWFAGSNVLYMRWITTGGRVVTYTYQRVYTIPYRAEKSDS